VRLPGGNFRYWATFCSSALWNGDSVTTACRFVQELLMLDAHCIAGWPATQTPNTTEADSSQTNPPHRDDASDSSAK
jgi:hypothetical protein